MLLTIAKYIPLIQCLTDYPSNHHFIVFKKFCFLWLISSLPVILAAILSPVPSDGTEIATAMFGKLKDSISVSELFVYSAAFLTPILYMVVEKYNEAPGKQFGEKVSKSANGLFRGYWLVAGLSLLVMFLTVVAFALIKSNPEDFEKMFLGHYLTKYVFPVYLFSLFCWYLTLLDSAWAGDFLNENRRSEDNMYQGFSDRLRSREG
jgi:hypothetical protein